MGLVLGIHPQKSVEKSTLQLVLSTNSDLDEVQADLNWEASRGVPALGGRETRDPVPHQQGETQTFSFAHFLFILSPHPRMTLEKEAGRGHSRPRGGLEVLHWQEATVPL